MITSQNKIVRFKPITDKEGIKGIWNRYDIRLDFEKEWDNFLEICENDNSERVLAVNNFLITEFLMVYCKVNCGSLNKLNCFCVENRGQISISENTLNKYKSEINNFLANFA